MYLRSLEIQGFKSFPDKTKLEFDKGITAVVGPNGSGKSNIGDAVRWVLGEQSSKTLRGAKMEDVIFAGTQFRKAMGFAQVTLEISNSDRVLPLPEDTVAVTRKLYRSGESEYLINGKPCRLKDITEMFMDTGMGRDGYSIIGQGRIAEIVSAKSGERRDIFEEAAGISKFRWKKAEAERRLASAEENILRLNDIVSALKERVEPLRKQSEKAEQFIELSEKKKSAEITVWIYQLDRMKEQLTELEEKILINTSDYDNIDAEIERAEERINELARDMRDGEIRIEELREQISGIDTADSDLRSEMAVCGNEIVHCEEKIKDYKHRQEDDEAFRAETAAKKEAELKRITEAEKEAGKLRADCEEAEKKLTSLNSEQETADSEHEKANSELNSLYMERSACAAASENSKSSSDALENRLAEDRAQTEELRKEQESLDKEKQEVLTASQKLDSDEEEINNRLSGMRKLYAAKKDKLKEIKAQTDEKDLKVRDSERRIKFLNDLESSMAGFNDTVRKVLNAASQGHLRGLHGSLGQLISVDNRYSTAVETALGAAIQHIVAADERAAKEAIAYLKANKAGRATFFPITTIKGKYLNENGLDLEDGFVAIASDVVKCDDRYKEIVRSQLGRVVIAEDIDSAAAIAKQYGYKFKIVTLDGQVVNAGGSFTGGSLNKSVGVLTRKTEINELNERLGKLKGEIAESGKRYERMKAEADKLGFDISAAEGELDTINSDRINFRAELKRICSLREQNERLIANAAEQEERIRRQIAEIISGAADAEKRLSEIAEMMITAEKTLSENSERAAAIRTEREALSEKISGYRIRAAELAKEIENAQSAVEALEEQQQMRVENTAALTEMIEEQLKLAEEKRRRIEECREELSHSGEKKERLNAGIAETQALSREKEQEATSLRRKNRELSDAKEKLAAEKTRLEEKRNTVRDNYDGIIRSMEEQYELYLSDARKLARPVDDIIAVNKELGELKQKIRALGNVNLSAIEEYREVSEKYRFMSGELNDVQESKRKLEDIIQDLTETMKKQFSECFAQINENFSRVFVELFGGGRGELVLTDPENVLESGIEINVAPPGKVIKSLSLLSGGEQAFVAIALYFAILMIRPSPFCILDEIEAALDDVNVTRYAQYLRHFTDTTQFIAVTHRRGTMEEADVIYGVTMQQKGISRLLKMEQPAADDRAG